VTAGDTPWVSVIVATYNWSSALQLALQSIAQQDFSDFEVLVVGDACTDDSAQVVAALDDHRFRWHNLARNGGNQWGPNNAGLAIAQGRYVAYLGHDDLWWPTHLRSVVDTAERTGADVVAAGALIYGPRESGIVSATGVFPHGEYRPRYFFPPSSTLHRRELAERIGGWHAPQRAQTAVDVDFLARCHAAGARFSATQEITVFKFSAAWRRNAYRHRDVSEQRAFLEGMRAGGEAFRLGVVTQALQAAVLDRLHRIELPRESLGTAEARTQVNRLFKGSVAPEMPPPPIQVERSRRRYAPPMGYAGLEWHAVESHARWGAFRWSGPSTRSFLAFPETRAQPLTLRLLVVAVIQPELLGQVRLSVDGISIPSRAVTRGEGELLLCGQVPASPTPGGDDASEPLLLRLDLPQTWRPLDLEASDDRRWLGLAVGWVEFEDVV
jgi:hypothetical protein